MNEQLIKFIELCLSDGIISNKEREVIFRKSKELGVPKDECEIILEGMINKFGNPKFVSDLSLEKPKNKNIKIEESYSDNSKLKSWFLNWLASEKEINNLKSNTSLILKDIIINEVDGSENKGSITGDFITKDTLLKMCDLDRIPDIPDSFWKKGKKGKAGSVENKYKKEILNVLQNEKFICYFSSTDSRNLLGDMSFPWTNKDLLQMIENYYNPTKKLGNDGWYAKMKSDYIILLTRHSVLITDNSVLEFKETTRYFDYSYSKINLEDINIEVFKDKFGYFDMKYRQIEGVLKSKRLIINDLIPEVIIHNNEKFLDVIEEIGLNDQTKRIINVDEKIQAFLDSKFNSQLSKFKGKDFYLFVLKPTIDVMGKDKINIVESSLVNSLHYLSLELFNVYLSLLTYRDSLVNLLLNKQEVELEGILLKFENSQLGMSKFEQTTVSQLEEINENLVKIKEVNREGFKEMSKKMDIVLEELDSINETNKEVVKSLEFNNFMSLVNTYQLYKVNKNTRNFQ